MDAATGHRIFRKQSSVHRQFKVIIGVGNRVETSVYNFIEFGDKEAQE
jgi:hypothetical protein